MCSGHWLQHDERLMGCRRDTGWCAQPPPLKRAATSSPRGPGAQCCLPYPQRSRIGFPLAVQVSDERHVRVVGLLLYSDRTGGGTAAAPGEPPKTAEGSRGAGLASGAECQHFDGHPLPPIASKRRTEA